MRAWIFSRKKTLVGLLGIVALLLGVLLCILQPWQKSAELQPTSGEEQKEVPIYFVEKQTPEIALSFDAAWGCERTEKILAILKQYDIKATFFLTNIWLEDYPDMAKKIAAAGHEIAMHSVTHPHMNQLSQEEVIQELEGNRQMIEEITGYHPTLFRFPFGEYNNQNVLTVRAQGYIPIQWSIDTHERKRKAREIKSLAFCLYRIFNIDIIFS